jgi:hypothetical protein
VAVLQVTMSSPRCVMVDAGRVTVLERWESEQELHRFRGSGPSDDQWDVIDRADVHDVVVPDD